MIPGHVTLAQNIPGVSQFRVFHHSGHDSEFVAFLLLLDARGSVASVSVSESTIDDIAYLRIVLIDTVWIWT